MFFTFFIISLQTASNLRTNKFSWHFNQPHVKCHLSPVTCHMPPTSTATDPPPANLSTMDCALFTMHSRLVQQDRIEEEKIKINCFKPKKGFLVLPFYH